MSRRESQAVELRQPKFTNEENIRHLNISEVDQDNIDQLQQIMTQCGAQDELFEAQRVNLQRRSSQIDCFLKVQPAKLLKRHPAWRRKSQVDGQRNDQASFEQLGMSSRGTKAPAERLRIHGSSQEGSSPCKAQPVLGSSRARDQSRKHEVSASPHHQNTSELGKQALDLAFIESFSIKQFPTDQLQPQQLKQAISWSRNALIFQ